MSSYISFDNEVEYLCASLILVGVLHWYRGRRKEFVMDKENKVVEEGE